jgi:hypothetical protein
MDLARVSLGFVQKKRREKRSKRLTDLGDSYLAVFSLTLAGLLCVCCDLLLYESRPTEF